MSRVLQPVLRPSSLSTLISSKASTTYVCQACRHARLLKRPKRPYTFTQLVTLSDGSAFTMRTTSPIPVYRSSRDTRNSPLWNPSSRDLLNVEEDEAGRLAGFRARFGKSFDASKEVVVETTGEPDKLASEEKANVKKVEQEKSEYDIQEDFGDEDDESLLEMISSFGKADKGTPSQIAKKKI